MSGPLFLDTVDGASGVDTGDIPASLRFRSAGSTRMSRTPAASNQKTFTISFWVKRGTLGVVQRILQSRDNGGSSANAFGVYFTATNTLYVYLYSSALQLAFESSALFRDPAAWYHIVVSIDTTQATASDRAKIYVNGVLQNTPSTLPAQNLDMYWNSAVQHNIGCFDSAGSYSLFLDGYLARICSIDGTALAPSSFGYLNAEINEWVSKSQSAVKAVVDAGGTNSFMLDFDDATSLTTLGYDKSSKNNDWTLNNFSLTAGTSYDRMLDVPGNSFATLNPIGSTTTGSCANGNLQANTANTGTSTLAATMAVSSGKWYWEYTPTAIGVGVLSGVIDAGAPIPSDPGQSLLSYGYYGATGNKINNGSFTAYGATYTVNDVIGVALDMDGGSITFYKNGVSQGVAFSGLSGTKIPAFGDGGTGTTTQEINCGQAPLHASATYHSAAGGYFRYAPPSGYKALCQRNMPDPAILNPEKHFDVVTYTGTAATKSITGLLFSPGLVEMKSRGRALDWAYYDSVRGVEKRLESNNTDAEVTGDTTGLTAFNSDGWTMGALDQINGTTATNSFVGSAWKAGGAAVTNNAGSISSQVSANVEAGFSIVTYTGTGANATVGHGLGKAPGLVIIKGRGAAWNWVVYNSGIGSGNYLSLNSTIASAGDATMWNNTSPTSSVFSVGTNGNANANGNTYVAYCFAEIPGFSKIFSYTGNGSADGPFVHCGFKPKFILYKRSDAAANWVILDSLRSPDNVVNDYLLPNSSAAEAALDVLDILSNGFKLRTTNADNNSGTIVGIAFADVPGKYALAR